MNSIVYAFFSDLFARDVALLTNLCGRNKKMCRVSARRLSIYNKLAQFQSKFQKILEKESFRKFQKDP
jgi:hypothetical protein